MAGSRFAVLRHRDFALYASSSFIWTIGLQVQATALAWQIYEITRDPFLLGAVGLLEFLPLAVLALPAGHLADRYDRRRIVLIGLVAELAAVALLTVLALNGRMSVTAILSLALTLGVARAISTPAARALLPSLLPKEDLAGGIAWSSISWQVATIAGPGLGGYLYSQAPEIAYGGATLAFAASLYAVFVMRGRAIVPAPPSEAEAGSFTEVLAGLILIFRHKLLLGAISLDLFAVLFSGATALIPVFAQDILHVGADAGGFLRSGQGIGAAMMAILLALIPLQRQVGKRLFIAIGTFGVAALVFGLSRSYWLSFAAVAVLGAADMVSIFVRSTLVPLATPDSLRGRVLAVESVFIGASNELGLFVAGTAAALLGPVTAVVAGGSLTLLVTATWSRLFPALRRVDKFTDLG